MTAKFPLSRFSLLLWHPNYCDFYFIIIFFRGTQGLLNVGNHILWALFIQNKYTKKIVSFVVFAEKGCFLIILFNIVFRVSSSLHKHIFMLKKYEKKYFAIFYGDLVGESEQGHAEIGSWHQGKSSVWSFFVTKFDRINKENSQKFEIVLKFV